MNAINPWEIILQRFPFLAGIVTSAPRLSVLHNRNFVSINSLSEYQTPTEFHHRRNMNSSIKLLFLCLLASPAFVRPFLRSPLFRALPTSGPNLSAKSSKPKGFGSSPPPPQTPKSPPLPSSSSGSPPAKVSEEAARLVNTGAVRLAELEAKKVSQKASILDTAISLTEEDNAAREGGEKLRGANGSATAPNSNSSTNN